MQFGKRFFTKPFAISIDNDTRLVYNETRQKAFKAVYWDKEFICYPFNTNIFKV